MAQTQTSTGALIGIEIGRYRGESFDDFVMLYYQDDGVTPADLTGCGFHMSIRTSDDAVDALADMTDANLGLAVDLALAAVTAPYLRAAVSAAWAVTGAKTPLTWDNFIVYPSGDRRLSHKGTIAVLATTTRYP